jgi:hypothetical protein
MERKACWRYKQFAAQARSVDGLPGEKAIKDACDPQNLCARLP